MSTFSIKKIIEKIVEKIIISKYLTLIFVIAFALNGCAEGPSTTSNVSGASTTCQTPMPLKNIPLDSGRRVDSLNFVDSGNTWPATRLPLMKVRFAADGLILDDGYPNVLNARMNAVASTAVWQREGARAFAEYQSAIPVNFTVSDPSMPADISISMQTFPAFLGNALGFGYYPTVGRIGLNPVYTFQVNPILGYTFFYSILHEAGHVFGLDHSNVAGAVMQATYSNTLHLTADDIAGLQSKYGIRPADAFESAGGNNSLANAYELIISSNTFSLPSSGDLSAGDVDFYLINSLPAGFNTATVTVNSSGLSLLSPKVELLNSAGEVLASQTTADEVFNGSQVTATAQMPNATNISANIANKIYIKVSGVGDFTTGKYTMTVSSSLTSGSTASPEPSSSVTSSVPQVSPSPAAKSEDTTQPKC